MTEELLQEIRRTNATLRMAFAPQLKTELEKLASTTERKRIWASLDGTLTAGQIATKLRVPKRTVDFFLAQASDAGWISGARGRPPIRLVDFVPLEWTAMAKKGTGRE